MFKRNKTEKKRRGIGFVLWYVVGSLTTAAAALAVFPVLIQKLAPVFSGAYAAAEPDERDEFGPDPVPKKK